MTTNRRLGILAATLALAAIAGILAWQLLPQGSTAKAAFEDACLGLSGFADLEHAAFDLDSTTVMTRGPGTEPELGESHIRYVLHPHFARHQTETWDEGTRHSESITIVLPDQSDESAARSADSEATYTVNTYVREYDENYSPTGWTTHTKPIGAGARTSQQRSANTNIFCGMNVDEMFTDFEYLGEETIDGVTTKHFTGLNTGEPETFTVRTDYWIGPNGLPVQQKVERVQDVQIEGVPVTRLVATTKVTGYGEENIITAPFTPNPAPEPDTPPDTATPTPEPEPTSTPIPVTWTDAVALLVPSSACTVRVYDDSVSKSNAAATAMAPVALPMANFPSPFPAVML